LPAGALIRVEDNQIVKAGVTLATMAKEASKTNDITGGLPRVSELFEARRPKEPAVLAKITGVVRFKGINKAKRVIVVEDEYGKAFEHEIPMNKRLLVRDGDKVKAGDKPIHFNRAAIKEAGYSDMVVVLVTNSFEYDEVKAL
jgi:DNA-directed RNA polymerase subunit beta'